ncbi:MAG: glycosyltransferase family 9 protein [Planctomycetota bacterium]
MRLSHLGDVVHALPVYHALRAAHPRAEIAWAVQPEFAGLLDGLPGLARTFLFERRRGARAWLRLLTELREWGPDWAVDAQGNAKSALATIGSGAGRRSGMHPRDWREPFAARVLTDHAMAVAGGAAHAMDRMFALAAHVAPDAGPPRRDPLLSREEMGAGRARLAKFVGQPALPATLLHLSSPEDVRSWPIASFESCARALAARGESVLVISGPQEEAEGRALAERTAGVENLGHWTGQRGLRELAALFAAAAERGGRIVACDSGPMHLAAAVGLPVVCLSGPQDEHRTGPWPVRDHEGAAPSPHRTLRASNPPPCAPCLARRCNHPEGRVCMTRITPAEVLLAGLDHGRWTPHASSPQPPASRPAPDRSSLSLSEIDP